MAVYRCKNKGCVGEGFIELTERQEESYRKKGLKDPANCPTCKKWRREQEQIGDQIFTCECCDVRKKIKFEYRLSYHRSIGVYREPTMCKLCQADPARAKRLIDERNAKQKLNELRQRGIDARYQRVSELTKLSTIPKFAGYFDQNLNVISMPTEIEAIEDIETYKSIPDRQHGNTYEHIVRHSEDKSVIELGIKSREEHFYVTLTIAKETDPSIVAQFVDGKNIIKRDHITGQIAVVKDNENPPPPQRLLTGGYVVDSSALTAKLTTGRWIPHNPL